MDYSLLLGVHDCEKAEQEEKERPDSQVRVDYANLIIAFFFSG